MLNKLSHIIIVLGLAIGILGGVVYVAATQPSPKAVSVQCETTACKQQQISLAFR